MLKALGWPCRAALWAAAWAPAVKLFGHASGTVLVAGGGWVAILAARLNQPELLVLGVVPVAIVAGRASLPNQPLTAIACTLPRLTPGSAAALLTTTVAFAGICTAALEHGLRSRWATTV
jgi:hypothetical protein